MFLAINVTTYQSLKITMLWTPQIQQTIIVWTHFTACPLFLVTDIFHNVISSVSFRLCPMFELWFLGIAVWYNAIKYTITTSHSVFKYIGLIQIFHSCHVTKYCSKWVVCKTILSLSPVEHVYSHYETHQYLSGHDSLFIKWPANGEMKYRTWYMDRDK
jgi:hypothetical protein